jgi:hypothetical protein
MITIDYRDSQVSVAVLGEFTLADFKEFEDLVRFQVKFEGPVNLFFDLREMVDFTVDMAWEEIKFSREHGGDFDRIAVVTDSEWVAWSAWLSQAFVDAELRVFHDADDARAWLDGVPE